MHLQTFIENIFQSLIMNFYKLKRPNCGQQQDQICVRWKKKCAMQRLFMILWLALRRIFK